MYKTRLGLLMRSTGENPLAVDMEGYSVSRVRYIGVLICGAMSGLGGAHLPLVILHNFNENMTAGRGFIALCIVILGRWDPLGILVGGFCLPGFTRSRCSCRRRAARFPTRCF